MRIIKTKGIILKEYTVGESDKFLSMFTKSNGKMMVNAPYAKKHNRGLASGTEVFVYGEFVIQEHKDNHKIVQASIIEAFHPIRKDLMKYAYCSYVLELIDVTMQEYLHAPDTLRLVVRTLQAMCSDIIPDKLILHIFELKHMSLIGFMPNVFDCVKCGKSIDKAAFYFDISKGGLVCNKHIERGRYCYKIQEGTVKAIQYVVSVHIDEIFAFKVSDKVLEELGTITRNYIEYYIDGKFKTLDFIKDMELLE